MVAVVVSVHGQLGRRHRLAVGRANWVRTMELFIEFSSSFMRAENFSCDRDPWDDARMVGHGQVIKSCGGGEPSNL